MIEKLEFRKEKIGGLLNRKVRFLTDNSTLLLATDLIDSN